MGKASRDKGGRNERNIVNEFREHDVPAERVPLSGAAGGSFGGDIIVAKTLRFEAKVRANGFRQLYTWLGGNDGLFVKADNKPTLAVIPLKTLIRLLRQGHIETPPTNCD